MQIWFIFFIIIGFLTTIFSKEKYSSLLIIFIIFVVWSEFIINYVWGTMALVSMLIGYFFGRLFKKNK
ncbi:hypothetical protein [Arcobacter porcinus]|uniref:Uncharacterized protein n=1 Tax=Arcobacter porcinus TaxID=1935204 RepID=A0A5C2HG67_9BACT|nr:hypothetical protein [Arcobacter porcinus]OCL97200.1 hypothetical protein AAX27_00107 [Aliarcobacter thereius]QEP39800.1 hypothetical protein APORC_0161 [Arcobacter porcinus]